MVRPDGVAVTPFVTEKTRLLLFPLMASTPAPGPIIATLAVMREAVATSCSQTQGTGSLRRTDRRAAIYFPQHFLYFFPLPQGHGSLRPGRAGGRGNVGDGGRKDA
jgi:hypothetical protein